MGRRSGKRRADRVPGDQPAVRLRIDPRRQSDVLGRPAAQAGPRRRAVSEDLGLAAMRSPAPERTDSQRSNAMSFKILLLPPDVDESWPEKIRQAVPGAV